ncbi:MAG: galactosyltransferase-related protein [Bacteroidia bacterium]
MLKQIKSLIPKSWKFPLWWIFKSPQREFGWFTLTNDLIALFTFCFYAIFRIKKLQPVSICTGIYNRSDMYLNHFLESLQHVKYPELIELSAFDCGSDDVMNLENEIRKKWKGKLKFTSEKIKFARAYSFNKAADQSSAEIIFICDADMDIPENIVSLCNHFTSGKLVWYPIMFYLRDKTKKNGHWMQHEGKGMLACRKNEFNKVGKLNEKFTEWGREDDELWERFMKAGYRIIRNRQSGLIHNWHESFNPKYKLT